MVVVDCVAEVIEIVSSGLDESLAGYCGHNPN